MFFCRATEHRDGKSQTAGTHPALEPAQEDPRAGRRRNPHPDTREVQGAGYADPACWTERARERLAVDVFAPMKLSALPVYHYLDHFTEMLSFVGSTFASVLTGEHRSFASRCNRLTRDARCLSVRMIYRLGAFSDRGHLSRPGTGVCESACQRPRQAAARRRRGVAFASRSAAVDTRQDRAAHRHHQRDGARCAAIADSFMDFMGHGIFAAHNVKFDYGFISRKFERLQRRFRFPKVCTCAGMRRRSRAHKSTASAI